VNDIRFEHVSFSYDHVPALRDVHATVPGGTVTGLIGPNGGGKSTLIKMVAGVLKPSDGQVLFDGELLRQARTRIAYVPQAREVNWDFPLSALDLVLMGRSREIGWFRRPGAGDRRRAEAALERLGLGGCGERHISQFSGGQQQRLFLARALVQDPQIVLLDEPLTGLDVTTREIIHELVREIANRGTAVLIATHDLEEVRHVCDRLICINREVLAEGPTAQVFTPATLRATFGGRVAVFQLPRTAPASGYPGH
jgi:manganese/zinc/iron transport system ATP- binding protein